MSDGECEREQSEIFKELLIEFIPGYTFKESMFTWRISDKME